MSKINKLRTGCWRWAVILVGAGLAVGCGRLAADEAPDPPPDDAGGFDVGDDRDGEPPPDANADDLGADQRVTDAAVPCTPGDLLDQACGDGGFETRTCVDGVFAPGSCTTAACTPGATEGQPCGLNGRGTALRRCLDWGQWSQYQSCVDVDACVDGAVGERVDTCGIEGTVRRMRRCVAGAWGEADAACRWTPCAEAEDGRCARTAEICDGRDNDGDGRVDEGLVEGRAHELLSPMVVTQFELDLQQALAVALDEARLNLDLLPAPGHLVLLAKEALALLSQRDEAGFGSARGHAALSAADAQRLERAFEAMILYWQPVLNAEPSDGERFLRSEVALLVLALVRWRQTGGPDLVAGVGGPLSTHAMLTQAVAALAARQQPPGVVGEGGWGVSAEQVDFEDTAWVLLALRAAEPFEPVATAAIERARPLLNHLQLDPQQVYLGEIRHSFQSIRGAGQVLAVALLLDVPPDDPRIAAGLALLRDSDLVARDLHFFPYGGQAESSGYLLIELALRWLNAPADLLTATPPNPDVAWPDALPGFRFAWGRWYLDRDVHSQNWHPMANVWQLTDMYLLFSESSYGLDVSARFVSRAPACANGLDDDGDGLVDFPADPQCDRACAPFEGPRPACSNLRDDDGDGLVDFPEDSGCVDAQGDDEGTACHNGRDDDGDGHIDFPNDPGCGRPSDTVEDPQCENGIDDDGDGLIDAGEDWDCPLPSTPCEASRWLMQCAGACVLLDDDPQHCGGCGIA